MTKKSKHAIVHIIAAVIFALVAIAHLLRIVSNMQVVIGNWAVPMWSSWAAVVVSALMAVLLRATAE